MKSKLVAANVGVLFLGFTGMAQADFVGNKDSKTFHTEQCSVVKQMKAENKVTFTTAAEALKAGYTACKKCSPADVTFVASKDGKKYHKTECRLAANIKADNLVNFVSQAEAEKAGYTPCSICLVADKKVKK